LPKGIGCASFRKRAAKLGKSREKKEKTAGRMTAIGICRIYQKPGSPSGNKTAEARPSCGKSELVQSGIIRNLVALNHSILNLRI
jgi:hypothetical protein